MLLSQEAPAWPSEQGGLRVIRTFRLQGSLRIGDKATLSFDDTGFNGANDGFRNVGVPQGLADRCSHVATQTA